MEAKAMEQIINEYIKAYNEFDVEKMLKNVHKDVEFKNITNGVINVQLKGLKALKEQAEQATNLFDEREMKIIEHVIKGNTVETKIKFEGTFTVDVPDGPKAGELVKINGKSIFQFEEGKIILIEDIS
ncbi:MULTISPECIES: nuclear transport factor 2 family protein [Methanobacterium]|jgi:predicted ester cyclase|uniref:Nuclear transport factor 2 family protein n=1 Tax=Methanobacterium veterum TaxID=408577 RepID=A0A9E5A1A8_9EURY|nr:MULTISPECIES: nuclear transport factor 2 family protein [Methanobacterium]MCZ3366999.1 nuclear transport factor 2 family protein [Methanobacterium veterum]MCZ3373854.1 nuclear transport factor 2 family protein [Methanobacterium veterum]